jgi:hypothetical protein
VKSSEIGAGRGLLASNWQAGVGAPLGIPLDTALATLGLPTASVPEPATLLPLGTWLAQLSRRRRRLRGKKIL